jgi:pyrimidine deaminase RibD-like protein
MSEQDIFEHLFSLFDSSDDQDGVVAACLVRDGNILAAAVSTGAGVHAEYALLQNLRDEGISIQETDVVYATIEPCGKRTPGGRGEHMGDCTTNLINAGVKRVVYGASDSDASAQTRHKFAEARVSFQQSTDQAIVQKAVDYFNATCSDPTKRLVQQ